MTSSRLLDKIRGCLVGAVVGDCLGSPVECKYWDGIESSRVQKQFETYLNHNRSWLYKFTDDTAMARQLAESLIALDGGLDINDLAKRFTDAFYEDPTRGYGGGVVEVFRKLREQHKATQENGSLPDVLKPGREQYDGEGSYGNGAAMRVHPVGVLGKDIASVKEMAEKQSRITHSHPDAVNGAVLQAVCVHLALHDKDEGSVFSTLSDLFPEEKWKNKLDLLPDLMDKEWSPEMISKLGNDISAFDSVPTAVFSYFRYAPSFPFSPPPAGEASPFQRTLEFAMRFGGDTDTIMSMAGAIAGAKYGLSGIPDHLVKVCEGIETAEQQAEDLHQLIDPTPMR